MAPAERETLVLHPAPPGLRHAVACLVLRHVGPAAQPLAARVHANTFACLNVVAQGHVSCEGAPLPARFLCGPLRSPRDTSVPGPLASASLVLAPWVLEPWLDLRPGALADQFAGVDGLQRPALQPLCDALAQACEHPTGLERTWSLLQPALARLAPPDLALSVLRSDGVTAAAAALGCSERQYRRRFQRRIGLGPAAWLRVRRWEEALQGLLAPEPPAGLAALAADHGYADQAHLARDTRDFVQATPATVRAAADWPLAPARVRILQDGESREP